MCARVYPVDFQRKLWGSNPPLSATWKINGLRGRCIADIRGMINEIELGDHGALFYRTKEEQLDIIIPFLALGLQRNERCLYIAEDNTTAEICARLQASGVDVREAYHRGALSVVTKRETYLRHGVFQPDKMIHDLCDAVQGAVDAGFAGLRGAAEMSWSLDLPSALAQIVEYEEAVEEQFYAKFAVLCQYDESRFPAHIVKRMKELHPVVVCGGQLIRRPSTRGLKAAV